MAITWQIPRNCLAWLLVTQFAVLFPHAGRLPWWVLLTTLCCTVWRIQIYQGRWSLPPKNLKVILAVLCFVGIYQSYGTFIGLEPTVALLFTGFSLKLLEVSSRRDVFFLIFLAYFVAATGFLFTQALWLVFYVTAVLLIITTSLVAMHQHDLTQFNWKSLRTASIIFLQAIPLMVILFLVFPRFEPLWSVPAPSNKARTGMSDTMSPGDVSRLGRSDELVFRAIFDGPQPQRQSLYWRGLVLSDFDGRTWYQSRDAARLLTTQEAKVLKASLEDPIRYRIIQEPTNQRWTYTLPVAYTDDPDLSIVSDFRIISLQPIQSRRQFDFVSGVDAIRQEWLSSDERHMFITLPTKGEEKSRAMAKQMRSQSRDVEHYVEQVLDYFTRKPFFYTLQPPLLGENPVDEFLFQTRKGFCEHYASSFVFLMRAANVPARVIAGYQGGDFNPLTGAVAVRQYDAHAWAEVWFEHRGWIRIDPTAAVSPLRIESGLESALTGNQEEFLEDSPLSPHRYRHVEWLNKLRLQLEMLDYHWTNLVLNYQGQRQFDLLSGILGEVSAFRITMLFLVVGGVVFVLVGWQLFYGRSQALPQQKLYLALCRALARAGLERKPAECPVAFEQRVAVREPRLEPTVRAITRNYMALSFETIPQQQRQEMLRQMRHQLMRLRLALFLN